MYRSKKGRGFGVASLFGVSFVLYGSVTIRCDAGSERRVVEMVGEKAIYPSLASRFLH